MTEKRFPFTKAKIEQLPVPQGSERFTFYDTRVSHLALRVTATGTKTFMVYRKKDGKVLKRTIGQFPDLSIEQARIAAQKINADLAQGVDPMDQKRLAKKELTLGELFDKYIEDYAKGRCQTWEEMVKNFDRNFHDWKDIKVSKIKKNDVQTRINKLGAGGAHAHKANRAHDDLRALFEWGNNQGLFSLDNPCKGIDRFQTQSRERFITRDELVKFFNAMQEICQTEIQKTIRDYILISLLTGARQNNVLSMRWEEIDFDLGLWRIPKTKHGESHTVPLTSFAYQVLDARRQANPTDWVFPGKKPGTHLAEPKSTWRAILKKAGLTDLRIHDLRRTLGSYMAIGNQSLQIIGKALGHKSSTSTQIYARLAQDPVRLGMEKAQMDMFSAGGLLTSASPLSEENT